MVTLSEGFVSEDRRAFRYSLLNVRLIEALVYESDEPVRLVVHFIDKMVEEFRKRLALA